MTDPKAPEVEQRIKAQFRAERKRLDYRIGGLPALYLRLARQWERPVQEIKRIVKSSDPRERSQNDA